MSNTTEPQYFENRSRDLTRGGLVITLVCLLLVLLATFVIRIGGAVVASGQLSAIGDTKNVQHQDGGIIKNILVSDSAFVQADDPLIVLDDTALRADLNILMFRQTELDVRLARLRSELSKNATFDYAFLRTDTQKPEITRAVETQKQIFSANRNAYLAMVRRLNGQIGSLSREVSALRAQLSTTGEQLGVLDQQAQELRPLVEAQLVAKSRQWQLERDELSVRGQIDGLNVAIAQTNKALQSARNELVVFERDHEKKLLEEIDATETEMNEVSETYARLEDQMGRLVIKSPATGIVHNLQHKSSQEIIQPGETILQIVPNSVGFEIEAEVSPSDIDQIKIGQTALLRFESFDAEKTPQIHGAVKEISADSLLNEVTGSKFYSVKVKATKDEFERLGEVGLLSGLPVTVMFETQQRSLITYLLKPIEQQTSRAFK